MASGRGWNLSSSTFQNLLYTHTVKTMLKLCYIQINNTMYRDTHFCVD